MNGIYICGAYDPLRRKVTGLKLLMTIEEELRGDYKGGGMIEVSGKYYVLGERVVMPKPRVVSYVLVPALGGEI